MYSHGDTDSIVISHTGLEDVSLVDSSEINRVYPIDTITTATIINETSLAGASATISESDISTENAALSMTLWEKTKIITGIDPEMASKYLGL
jgi:hypothetical protein